MQPTVPMWDNCDQDDPRQALQPALIDLPIHRQKMTPPMDGENGGTIGDWSEALHKRGLRFHPELAQVKYIPPPRGPQHVGVNSAGGWVDINEPDREPVELMDMSANTPAENEYYAEQLHYLGISHDKEAPPVLREGQVRPTFTPVGRTVAEVRAYLIDRPDHEVRRVIGLEMSSKKPRMSLLKHFPGV